MVYFFFLFLFPCILIPLVYPSKLLVSYLSVYLSAGYWTFRISFATLTFLEGLWMFYWVSLNLNRVSPGGESKQKLSCVWQLPSYQSGDLISFLKGPIVSSKACEIAGCWVTVNGGAAGRWVALPRQPTAVRGDGRCEDLTPPSPSTEDGKLLVSASMRLRWQIPLQIWVTATSQTVRCFFIQVIPKRKIQVVE